jgi:ZIP family zinc transporter
VQGYPLVLVGLAASMLAGAATGEGARPIFLTRDVPEAVEDAMLGFAAGVMLAAAAFSLLVPAIDLAGAVSPARPPPRSGWPPAPCPWT